MLRSNSINTVLSGEPADAIPRHDHLPLLEPSHDVSERQWLESSLTTFGYSVASILPGHFETYVRIYHPFQDWGEAPIAKSWAELAGEVNVALTDPEIALDFARNGVEKAQAREGRRPPFLVEPLIENLKPATTTPGRCFFAVWEGFGDSIAEDFTEPRLALPARNYHVFEGPIEASRTSFSQSSIMYTAANLWWPADRAWFVSTEIDFAWTYVGGSRSLIDALLKDPRLDCVETDATSRW